jgi:hypothetical protein
MYGTLAVRIQRQEGGTSLGSIETSREVPFKVDPDARNGESEVGVPIQPRYLLSPETHDSFIVRRSKVTTLFDVQSHPVGGRLPNDDIQKPLNLRRARRE